MFKVQQFKQLNSDSTKFNSEFTIKSFLDHVLSDTVKQSHFNYIQIYIIQKC